MRTTIRLDEGLLREAKERAAGSGRTLTSIIEEALRSFLRRPQGPVKSKRPELPTFRGRGLQSGVDLDNTAALLDLMDRGDAPR
jgi:hypothetical protein